MDEKRTGKKSFEDTMKMLDRKMQDTKMQKPDKNWEVKRFQLEKKLLTLKNDTGVNIPALENTNTPDDTFISLEKGNRFFPLLSIFLCLLFVGGIYFFLQGGLTGLATLNTVTTGDFKNGTYFQTFHNTTANGVQLMLNSSFLSGNYSSNISQVGSTATWNNISFVTSAFGELATGQQNEENPFRFGSNNLNMTGNFLYYRFNNETSIGENRTIVYDFHGLPQRNGTYNTTGTISNASSLSPLLGNIAYFNGSDEIIVNGGDLPVTGMNGTFMAWIRIRKALTLGDQYRVVSSDDAYEFVISSTNGQICSFQVDGAWTNNPTWQMGPGKWYHIACLWNRTGGTNDGTEYLYINGQLNFSFNSGAEMDGTPINNTFKIGFNTGNAYAQHFIGDLDELALFNRTLTPDEIRNAYLRGVTRLNISVRSCDDSLCDTETFTALGNSTSPQILSVANNPFFQYLFNFNASDGLYSPLLYNVTVDYTLDTTPPNVTEQIPSADSPLNITQVIQIAANATDGSPISQILANISYPNGSIILFTLANGTGYPKKFNMSFTVPELLGNYNITFIANDTLNNKNTTKNTNFTVKMGCATVMKSNTLDQDLTAGNTCFNISANHVEINCVGKMIKYGILGAGNAFNNSGGYDNITIKNCLIRKGSVLETDNHGIHFNNGAINSTIANNTIFTDGTSDNYGIYFAGGTNSSTIENNTIITNGSIDANYGITFIDATNNTLTANNITTQGTTNNYGIDIVGFSGENVVRDNRITATGRGTGNYAIYLESGEALPTRTLLINNNFTSNSSDFIIRDDTSDGTINYLIYNSTFGEIRWIDNGSGSFVRNLTFNITNNLGLGLGRNIFIGNNTLAFNSSAQNIGKMNGSLVNLSLFGLNLTTVNVIQRVENFTTDVGQIQAAGVNCISTGSFHCDNISYIGNTLRFNSSSFSSFAANVSTFSGGAANTLPTASVTGRPFNGSSITNRTPTFEWFNSSDADGNVISYHLQVDDNILFNNPEINVSAIQNTVFNVANTSFFPTTVLNVDTKYYWRVRANDSTGYGAWSDGSAADGPSSGSNNSNFTINSLLAFSFLSSSVEFGTLAPGISENTTDNSPLPFHAENSGNIFLNVTVNGSAIFSSVGLNTSNYQFQMRANESSSFDALSSTVWKNMSKDRYNVFHLVELNWRDASDDYLMDINVTVPSAESAGVARSIITFTIDGSGTG